LVSSRIDRPGEGENAVADALARAAATFTEMAIEHKQKDDALSYANAKNEYLIASIEEQDKLQDDQDFATHGRRYTEAMKGHYERLFPTVKSERDRHLFDAEARLMDARGNVAVGDNARVKEIDWNLGQFAKNATAAQGIILAAPNSQIAQDAMFGVLEQGAAIRERGYWSEEEYQTTMQEFVTGTAERRLIAMDSDEREILLERSIVMAKTRGKPITREQIRNGEGSGSIADFIPLDVRVSMLEETRKANKHDDTWREAYQIFDEIESEFNDPVNIAREIKERGKGLDPDVRTALNELGARDRSRKKAVKEAVADDIMRSSTELMRDQGWTYDQIPSTELAKLGPAQDVALRRYSELLLDGKNYAGSTRWVDDPNMEGEKSYAYWRSLTEEEKEKENLQSAEWFTATTQRMHKDLVDEQQRYIDKVPTIKDLPGGMTNVQMVTSALVRAGHIPQTGRDIDESEAYQQLLWELDRATQAEMERTGKALTNTERDRILGEIMAPRAFTDHYGWWFGEGWPDTDEEEKIPIAAMSVSQRHSARLNWDDAATEVSRVSSAGVSSTYKQDLELMATRLKVKPSRDEYERAYFALKYGHRFGWGSEQVKKRLMGDE
jgi:hypothetical protein